MDIFHLPLFQYKESLNNIPNLNTSRHGRYSTRHIFTKDNDNNTTTSTKLPLTFYLLRPLLLKT